MTDTRKYIEEQFDQFFEFDTDDRSTVTSASCRFFAEHCIADLLAVIELQRQALKYYADGGHIRHLSNGECAFEYGDIAQSALALTADDVELVEYAEMWNHGEGRTGIQYKNDLRKGDIIDGEKLYKIQMKGK